MKKCYFTKVLGNMDECNPDIAEALLAGHSILCHVSDREPDCSGSTLTRWVIRYDMVTVGSYKYDTEGSCYKYAIPVVRETKVKSVRDILKTLAKEGYILTKDGDFESPDADDAEFVKDMFQYCGELKPSSYYWKESWLTDKEV